MVRHYGVGDKTDFRSNQQSEKSEAAGALLVRYFGASWQRDLASSYDRRAQALQMLYRSTEAVDSKGARCSNAGTIVSHSGSATPPSCLRGWESSWERRVIPIGQFDYSGRPSPFAREWLYRSKSQCGSMSLRRHTGVPTSALYIYEVIDDAAESFIASD
jgi:hypothetical protein